ncbi:Uncharacterised protein [Chlamydia trachomatis]|nr:Uncharacterised protein [Chlamydia trachomatis]
MTGTEGSPCTTLSINSAASSAKGKCTFTTPGILGCCFISPRNFNVDKIFATRSVKSFRASETCRVKRSIILRASRPSIFLFKGRE